MVNEMGISVLFVACLFRAIGHIKLPDVIAIPFHAPLRSRLKKGAAIQIGGSEVGVGLVTVDRHGGEMKYEGQTLAPAPSERMVVACRKLPRGKDWKSRLYLLKPLPYGGALPTYRGPRFDRA